jgi:hypothetical protein
MDVHPPKNVSIGIDPYPYFKGSKPSHFVTPSSFPQHRGCLQWDTCQQPEGRWWRRILTSEPSSQWSTSRGQMAMATLKRRPKSKVDSPKTTPITSNHTKDMWHCPGGFGTTVTSETLWSFMPLPRAKEWLNGFVERSQLCFPPALQPRSFLVSLYPHSGCCPETSIWLKGSVLITYELMNFQFSLRPLKKWSST